MWIDTEIVLKTDPILKHCQHLKQKVLSSWKEKHDMAQKNIIDFYVKFRVSVLEVPWEDYGLRKSLAFTHIPCSNTMGITPN